MNKRIKRGHAASRDAFFCQERGFYRQFLSLLGVLALQNTITYTINILDNIMLGAYSQTSLAAAAAVNQIQFVLQSFVIAGLGDGLIVLASQYWGRHDTNAIEKLTGTALLIGVSASGLLTLWSFMAPYTLLRLFTSDPAVQAEGVAYLSIIRFSYLLFTVLNLLLLSLRSVQIVRIAFRLSLMALGINGILNYMLIFGHWGAPELGIRGAALGTLAAEGAEFAGVVFCCVFRHFPLHFSPKSLFAFSGTLAADFVRVSLPCTVSALLFSGAVSVQTIILGHTSSDALAAYSAASTFFQYLKMVPVSAASASAALIGQAVGSGQRHNLRPYVHTLQLLYLFIGVGNCLLTLLMRQPLLSLYILTPLARQDAQMILTIFAFISIGTAYQMPCQCGIIRGGGDTRYVMISDLLYSWGLVVPLSLAATFCWHWPLWAVVLCMNFDQLAKCLTVGIKTNRYTWIRTLTHN